MKFSQQPASLTRDIQDRKNSWDLVPFFGAIVYIILYFIASCLYPGGSYADKTSHGFSWANNYWCNLLQETAINGERNPGRPFAMAGMAILCFTIAFFWYSFPKAIDFSRSRKIMIQASGILAMTIALFLSTRFHDIIINVAGGFGIIALIGTFMGLHKLKWSTLFWFGIINLLLVILNNIFYRTESLFVYLAVLQKISFASFLTWISCISVRVYQSRRSYPGEL